MKRFLIFILIVVIGIFLSGFTRKFVMYKGVETEVDKMKQEIAYYEKRNTELGHLIKYVSSDSYLEEEARLKFGLKKPGEQLVIMNEDEVKPEVAQIVDNFVDLPNPVRWWKLLFVE